MGTQRRMTSSVSAAVQQCSIDPGFTAPRIALFQKIKAQQEARPKAAPAPITVTLPDGRVLPGEAGVTTPMDIAKLLGRSISEAALVAKINGKNLVDLSRPLEQDCLLQLLTFDDDEGRQVFWHSSAHVLGEACEGHFHCHVCLGPPTEDGFYYEIGNMPEGRTVGPADFLLLEERAKKICREKQQFERLEMTREELLEMFSYNPYKCHLIREKVPPGTSSTVYRCGPLIDLCLGPHVPDTGRIRSFKLLKASSCYFLGDSALDQLQRIYGVAFPSQSQMDEHLKFLREADENDHRKVGREQSLYFFHEMSPGSCFWLPHGARLYNTLVDFMRSEYRKRGFTEVITPNIFNVNLWKTSGHWDNYRENMYSFEVEKVQFAMKPMNCPGHCLMFAHEQRSYRELPIRFADFGVLHRNEISGSLSGLTRVRRFQQDDAHIFCTTDQIESEISGCLDFLRYVYEIFGFQFALRLSTRPEKFMGEVSVWDQAERQLASALDASGLKWEVNPGDGAFYGPKIDITISDAHRRQHQCGTIQLDFQLPIRFDLRFKTNCMGSGEDSGDFQRPVIVHRAILGSIERMVAILVENFARRWPFWLSPRQICVVPVSHASDGYAQRIHRRFFTAGFNCEVDLSDCTLNKKVRNAETQHFSFIVVVGHQEEAAETVNIRRASSDGKDAIVPVGEAVSRFQQLIDCRSRENKLFA